MGKRLDVNKQDLERYYIDDGLFIKDIAEIYGCCPDTIGKYLDKFGITKRTSHPWTSELNKILKKQYNRYDLSGDYGVGWTLNTSQEFYFDLEDYKLIKDICWCETDEGYIAGRSLKTNEIIRMHNLVTGFQYVDHIKHKPYDNRKSQLRAANDRFNSRNRTKPVNNVSGYKGVCWKTREQKWRAYITVDGKHIELGMYDDINEAIEARKKADEYYYKEWSYENSMNNKED